MSLNPCNLKLPNKLQFQYPKWPLCNQPCPRCQRWATWLVSMRNLIHLTISKRPSLRPQISTLYWIYTTNNPAPCKIKLHNTRRVAFSLICKHLGFSNNNNPYSSRLSNQWCKWTNSCSKSNNNFSSLKCSIIKVQISNSWCRCSKCSKCLSPNFSIKTRATHLALFNRHNILKLAHLVISKVRHLLPNKNRISIMGALSIFPLITRKLKILLSKLLASLSTRRWTRGNPSRRQSSTLL